jgi:hypothetical protein
VNPQNKEGAEVRPCLPQVSQLTFYLDHFFGFCWEGYQCLGDCLLGGLFALPLPERFSVVLGASSNPFGFVIIIIFKVDEVM